MPDKGGAPSNHHVLEPFQGIQAQKCSGGLNKSEELELIYRRDLSLWLSAWKWSI